MHLSPPHPQWLRLMSVLRRCFCCCWSVVWCAIHWLWGLCFCLCFVVHYCVSFLVLQSSLTGRESWLLCSYVSWMSFYCKCSVTLPYGAVGWSAVCDCGISWSYSLFDMFYDWCIPSKVIDMPKVCLRSTTSDDPYVSTMLLRPCADPESFVRGGPILTTFVLVHKWKNDPNITISGPSSARQQNAI